MMRLENRSFTCCECNFESNDGVLIGSASLCRQCVFKGRDKLQEASAEDEAQLPVDFGLSWPIRLNPTPEYFSEKLGDLTLEELESLIRFTQSITRFFLCATSVQVPHVGTELVSALGHSATNYGLLICGEISRRQSDAEKLLG